MDVRCVVCGEPWDYYGIDHGDMEAWEATLFKAGSGCPCCEGKPTEKFEPTSVSDFEFGDEDPILRIYAYDDAMRGVAPKWKKPEPKVFWKCDGCGVEVIGDPAFKPDHKDYLIYNQPKGAKCNDWHVSHPFWKGTPEEEPAHVFQGGDKVCEYCLQHCSNCSREVCSTLEFGDTYDDGNAFPDPNNQYTDVICIDCYETVCSECQRYPEDCECSEE